MKAYTAYARGEGVWNHCTLSPRKSTFIFNHWQCIIKYCTCLECGQYAHICRSFMYNNTFDALFLTSKCTKRGFLWTQTVAPHRGFCKAAQRRYRIFSTWADSIVHKIAPNCEYFTNRLMQYVLQNFYNKNWDIRNTRNNEKSDSGIIPPGWSVDYSGPSHVAEPTCIFTLFNVERWSAAWSLIINKCRPIFS